MTQKPGGDNGDGGQNGNDDDGGGRRLPPRDRTISVTIQIKTYVHTLEVTTFDRPAPRWSKRTHLT
jgi:hypothetical protein